MLFLNRRGYAPLTLCRACGFRFRCPNCAAWLVSHRFGDRLTCHHCGYNQPRAPHCPDCGAIDSLAVAGPGVERVHEEVKSLFPDARTVMMTSDTITSAANATALVDAMLEHRIDILIGTQLIAKGHHFPDLTLAGVVDADFGLAGGDPRAAERSFQLLYQLAGRAGREAKPGRVLIQTHLPDHPVMQALAKGDREAFMAAEQEDRREFGHAALWHGSPPSFSPGPRHRSSSARGETWSRPPRSTRAGWCSARHRRLSHCCAAATANAS